MGWHGVGSLNSPIVISDDEDETLVERALEDRSTDPQDFQEQDLEPFDYGEDDAGSGPSLVQGGAAETAEITVISESTTERKRKRSIDAHESTEHQHLADIASYTINAQKKQKMSPNRKEYMKGESKSVKRKKRKRERLEAEAAKALAVTSDFSQSVSRGPSRPPTPPSQPAASSSRLQDERVLSPPLRFRSQKPESEEDYLPPPLPPPPEDVYHGPPPFHPSYEPFPPQPAPHFGPLPFPPHMEPHFFPHHPIIMPPFNIEEIVQANFIHAMQNVVQMNDQQGAHLALPSSLPRTIVKKIIGMTADLNEARGHGVFATSSSPALDRTLVMECLPKKFRTEEFVRMWALRFGAVDNLELDLRIGKALVVFKNAKSAREAWSSPRFATGEGREHIRAYWYRAHGSEFEEGEIEEWELENIQSLREKAAQQRPPPVAPSGLTKPKNTAKAHAPAFVPPPPPPSAPSIPSVRAPPPAKIHPSRLPFISSSYHAPTTPPGPPSPTRPAPDPQTILSPIDDAMDVASDDGLPMQPIILASHSGFAVPAVPEVTGSLSASSASLDGSGSGARAQSPRKDTSAASSSDTASGPTDLGVPPLSQPVPQADGAAKARNLKDSLLARQKELEARIARGRLELAQRTQARAVSDSPAPSTPSNSAPAAASQVDPKVPAVAETAQSAASLDASALRQRVLASKRTKAVASGPSTPVAGPSVSTNGVSVPSSDETFKEPSDSPEPFTATTTTTTMSFSATTIDFNDLAATFITESIQAVMPHPVPPSRPPSAARPALAHTQSSGQATLSAKLDKQLAIMKSCMKRLESAKTKAERDAIKAEYKLAESAMKGDMSAKSGPIETPPSKIPLYPIPKASWPKQKEVIIDISDDEQGEEEVS